ncbi:unnamed protein product [Spirodela intermedia]|uniref:Uncharacterized protein n=1 Tax=Spirodela intermedia TaxID=51605 RepID=A0A7I8IET5_SPIIN|nr:unnamed protein product [Spirodela intermedia]CAA6656296.1 unnamed protein product [Spirodela intermedia]
MNFLLRSTNSTASNLTSISEDKETLSTSLPGKTLEGLIAEDPFPSLILSTFTAGPIAMNQASIKGHVDVSEDDGWITIPYKELPENWNDVPDIRFFHSLDRQFVFPGEQLHILACLSVPKKDAEIITPFRVSEVMNKNGSPKPTFESIDSVERPTNAEIKLNGDHQEADSKNVVENGETTGITDMVNTQLDVSATESFLQSEDHKQRTRLMLENFRNSHYFVRIAESDEPLWSKARVPEVNDKEPRKLPTGSGSFSAFVDRGNFDGNVSGGVARNSVTCCSLHNGDIVVLLEVNVGIDNIKDPVLEILQFEKFESSKIGPGSHFSQTVPADKDPYGDLLTWLIPVDRVLPPPGRSLSPPLSSAPGIGSASQKSTASSLSGSQLFSFGNFRSYSMSAIPQATVPASPAYPPPNTKPSLDLEDFDRFSSDGATKKLDFGTEGILSFRGVPLEPERFSSHCGLEGSYIPGRRWRKKLEIIQPLEIHSFGADCNTEDLVCVQVKNVSPAHLLDIVIFIDAITIVFEEAPKDGPPICLPISCIEAGNEYSLPNLSLRRAFIHFEAHKLNARDLKGYGDKNSLPMPFVGTSASNAQMIPKVAVGRRLSSTDQYAVLVSCRCNYTETHELASRFTRDLMVSVASEISAQTFGPSEGLSQLPVQEMTLQASNLTNEDLTLTVLAPASFTSPPSVMSLNSSPTSPMTPSPDFQNSLEDASSEGGRQWRPEIEFPQRPYAGGFRRCPSADLGCSHLWLQSIVPLGTALYYHFHKWH